MAFLTGFRISLAHLRKLGPAGYFQLPTSSLGKNSSHFRFKGKGRKMNPIYVKLHFYFFTILGPRFDGNDKVWTQYINFLISDRARGILHVHYLLRLNVQSAFCTSKHQGMLERARWRLCSTWNLLILAIWCRFRLCDNFQPPCFIALEPFHHGLFDGISDQFGPFKETWPCWLFSTSYPFIGEK